MVKLFGGELLVGVALAVKLYFLGFFDLCGNCLAVVGVGLLLGEFRMGDGGDLDLHVDAVKERAREFVLVAGDLVWCAAASAFGVSEVAAGAGVHGSDELEACGVLGALGGSDDGDLTGFEWFTQGFECVAGVFGEFVQEEDAVMCE